MLIQYKQTCKGIHKHPAGRSGDFLTEISCHFLSENFVVHSRRRKAQCVLTSNCPLSLSSFLPSPSLAFALSKTKPAAQARPQPPLALSPVVRRSPSITPARA